MTRSGSVAQVEEEMKLLTTESQDTEKTKISETRDLRLDRGYKIEMIVVRKLDC